MPNPDPYHDPGGPPQEFIINRFFLSQITRKIVGQIMETKRTGSIEGTTTPLPPGGKNKQHVKNIKCEILAGRILGLNDHAIYNPLVVPEDDLGENKNPDYRINGDIWDCYTASKEQDSPRGIWSAVRKKVQIERQTKRVVIFMTDTPVTLQEISDEFARFEMTGLIELTIIRPK
ncbi:MAG: hypothetical protein OIF54_18945 [Cohaesibacter sp.]|nr:hypothetical protein [Cohaesibacter sp.]